MKLSVILPCYNAEKTLGLQLEALAKQQWSQPWESIVADNRSTDRSREIAESYQGRLPNLRIVDASEKKGVSFTRNMAIRLASGESFALCDADDEVGEGWVAAMGEALLRRDFVACRVDTAKLNPPWLRGHQQELGLQTIWYPPWLPHVGGGTMGFKKRVFDAIGGFDESMMHLEDTEFCFQAQRRGFVIHFVPEAVLHVRRRNQLEDHFRQSCNYAEYNVVLAKKYWPTNQSARGFYQHFVKDWIRLALQVRSLRTEHGRFAWAWLLGQQTGRLKGVLFHGGVPV